MTGGRAEKCRFCGIDRIANHNRPPGACHACNAARFERRSVGGWIGRARCAGADTELWYSTDRADQAAAKVVCGDCPVIDDCLAHALNAGEAGIWGGTTEDERRAISSRRARGRDPVRPVTVRKRPGKWGTVLDFARRTTAPTATA